MMTAEEERWARGIAGEWGYGPEYLAPLEITMAHHIRLALEEIDRLRAAVAEEREACLAVVRSAREDPEQEEYADWVNGILAGVETAIRARGEKA
jgi:hypothetical protein